MIPDLREELATAELGDARRTARLLGIVGRLQDDPGRPFPKVFRDNASLEALYRFTNNDAVEPAAVLEPHRRRSWERSAAADETALVLHDSSFCSFPGDVTRRGLPRDGQKQGFYLHAALAVSEGLAPVVYGLVGFDVYTVWDGGWFRETGGEREELWVGSQRWGLLVDEVHDTAPEGRHLVHVMDREADDYALWSTIRHAGGDFVIRAQHDRRVKGTARRLSEAVAVAEVLGAREVPLRRRSAKGSPPRSRKRHPDRHARVASLRLQSARVEFVRPAEAAPLGEPILVLWIVEVTEVEPPQGEPPVHWRLVSTLPADTPEAAWRVVDIYRKRWLIEEYFKALKTGCELEARQAESLEALLHVLALLLPMAWRLLVIRATERTAPESSAESVLPELELAVLRQQVPARMLPKDATARHVLLAIAYLGGHLRSNGPPGWLVLGRGLEHLITLAAGWRAALAWMRTDPSRGVDDGGESEM